MLYLLVSSTRPSAFNVFRQITFRTLLAGLMALAISLCLGPALIRCVLDEGGQQIRDDGPERIAKADSHDGGVLILFSGVDPAARGPRQRLRLGRAHRDARLRRDRLRRRLPARGSSSRLGRTRLGLEWRSA